MFSRLFEPDSGNPRLFLVPFLVGALLLVLISCVAFAITPTIAGARGSNPASSRPVSWAKVEIPKPTYAPTSVRSLTPTSAPATLPAVAATEITTASPQAALASTPTAPDVSKVSPAGKYILVSISQQHLYAYNNGQLIYSFVASTGSGNSTKTGTFSVLDKIPNAYGPSWNFWMPDWMGIYWAGTLEDGIHSLPVLANGDRLWADALGTPISYGCVVLGIDDALKLYNWADVGTPVEIRR